MKNFTRLIYLLSLTALAACSVTSHSRTLSADPEIAEPINQAQLTDSAAVPR